MNARDNGFERQAVIKISTIWSVTDIRVSPITDPSSDTAGLCQIIRLTHREKQYPINYLGEITKQLIKWIQNSNLQARTHNRGFRTTGLHIYTWIKIC